MFHWKYEKYELLNYPYFYLKIDLNKNINCTILKLPNSLFFSVLKNSTTIVSYQKFKFNQLKNNFNRLTIYFLPTRRQFILY